MKKVPVATVVTCQGILIDSVNQSDSTSTIVLCAIYGQIRIFVQRISVSHPWANF